LIASFLIAGSSIAAEGCAEGKDAGGAWPAFGHDLSNTRSQPQEDELTPDTVPLLLPKWTFSVAGGEGEGNFQSTPVVADGCLYAGTNTGWIFALNADTGELVWKTNLASSDLLAGLSGGVFALAVGDGRVYANVSRSGGPYTVALDQRTGKELWKTVVAKEDGSYTNSSVALIEGMVFIGISGPEDVGPKVRHPGGFALLDADTGKLITRTYTVSKADDARGLKGASLWGTPVYDSKTGYMYDGTGQPANKDREHSYSNAILKIDVDRGRGTFGEIVGSYHGDYDDRADVDFGGSPNLFTDSKGRPIVTALQKSGKYHAVFADNMEQAWWVRISSPLALGNAGTAAVDKKSVYISGNTTTTPPSTNDLVFGSTEPTPGYLFSLDKDDGTVNWRTPVAGIAEYHLISEAGGVVYIVTTHGLLLGVDASNGLPVVVRSLSADAADPCVNLSSGAIIARHTVYAVCDIGASGNGWIVAYGL
jgi:outer membrane protein assembly factor BamB